MRISANIVETNDEINTMILEIMADHINDTLNIAMPKITTEIKELVALSLREEPEYQSLLSGRLKAEFGLSDTNMVDNIIDYKEKSHYLLFKRRIKKIIESRS